MCTVKQTFLVKQTEENVFLLLIFGIKIMNKGCIIIILELTNCR